jgi:RNA 2',3'-cyclic 3'-phosphodiesterase
VSSIRTFVAIDVSPAIRSAAGRQIKVLQGMAPGGYTWVDLDNLHLTFKFLGNVRDNEVPDVCRAVQRVVQEREPVVAAVAGLGAFPDIQRPRTVWMGITEGAELLVDLQRRIDGVLKELGFPLERNDFQPHITLGRIAKGAARNPLVSEYLQQEADTAFGGLEIDEVIVYSSFEDKSGRSYTPMATIGLEG